MFFIDVGLESTPFDKEYQINKEVSVSSEIFRKQFSKLVIYPQEESIPSRGGRYSSSKDYGDP